MLLKRLFMINWFKKLLLLIPEDLLKKRRYNAKIKDIEDKMIKYLTLLTQLLLLLLLLFKRNN